MKSVEHVKTFEIAVPVADLFPLFSPEGEKKWVPGWDYHSPAGTTELAEDHVFLTTSHDHGTTEAIWLVKKYEPDAHLVEYYKVEPEDKVGVVRIQCRLISPGKSEVEVGYKYLALSPVGERFISEFNSAVYDAFIGEWQVLLTDYFNARA